jgi:hypothetical protein
MQRIADLEAQVAALTSENEALRAQKNEHSHPQPNSEELANAIGTRLTRVEQNLREDFVGKFAASFLLASETITGRLNALDQHELELEERQQNLETKLQNHYAAVGAKLDEAGGRQRKSMTEFASILNQHLAHSDTLLKAQQATVESCNRSAAATAKSAALCTNFAEDYTATSAQAGVAIQSVKVTVERELTAYLRELKTEALNTVTPVINEVQHLTERQYLWRLRLIIISIILGIGISSVIAWVTQPSSKQLFDAARWRHWQEGFAPDQLGRINNLLKEIDKEEDAKKTQEGDANR